jgi:ABC-type iron transport system FetAB ATPase subunit
MQQQTATVAKDQNVGEPMNGSPLLRIEALVSPHAGPFSLQVAAGECVVVVGRSGSGKSVLLRLIADLDPHDGQAWLDGRSRASWTGPHWRGQVVYQAAEPAWWEPSAAAHLRGVDRAALTSTLERLGLTEAMLDADIIRLSTGERQRMAFIRSLDRFPRVLLLDEPTASLDHASTLAVEALLAEKLKEGLAAVVVTHSPEQAERIGHRVLEVRDQRLHQA